MDLSATDQLEGLYGLTAKALGLTEDDYQRRAALWEQLASQRPVTGDQMTAHVRALALTAWITRLMQQADKFRAEGDVTVEKDIMSRVALLQGWLKEARTEAGLDAPAISQTRPSGANPAPNLEGWGIGGSE